MASEKTAALIEEIKALTVLELSELVKALEEEFGVFCSRHGRTCRWRSCRSRR